MWYCTVVVVSVDAMGRTHRTVVQLESGAPLPDLVTYSEAARHVEDDILSMGSWVDYCEYVERWHQQ